jgi:hypothetical protein
MVARSPLGPSPQPATASTSAERLRRCRGTEHAPRPAHARDLIADPASGRLIVAGWFTALDGSSSRAHLGAVSLASGGPAAWESHPGSDFTRVDGGDQARFAIFPSV